MADAPATFEAWLDETFGRAVAGEHYPAFVHRDVRDWPEPVGDHLALAWLTRLFENPSEELRYFSDAQIAAGLWELGPSDAHCVYNRDLPIAGRLRLIRSVATFFRDFFDPRCLPKLAHLDRDVTEPLNGICYMWWEVITWGWAKDDPDADRLKDADLEVMEQVLELPNPACQESALHGLGHMVRHSSRAAGIIEAYLASPDHPPELDAYARAALSGCIQ
jgi:hypothetical protein